MLDPFVRRLGVYSLVPLLFAGSIAAPAATRDAYALSGSATASIQAPVPAFDTTQVKLQLLVSGLNAPVFVTHAGDGSNRLFIVQQPGQILVFKNGALLATPFLDIHTLVKCCGEQGLLGLVFDPGYRSNGQFFVAHTAPLAGDSTGSTLTLARYSVSAGNSDQADPTTGTIILTVPHPVNPNHNAGMLAFGPDGYLYWSTGDGGSGGDPPGNAQNLGALLGKILRLDVHSAPPYAIPPTNPFFSNPDPSVRKEIWAYGLRNPWRSSFDRQTGDLWIGDVGQNLMEEVDFQPAASPGGVNYGWKIMEGTLCFNPANFNQPLASCNKTGLTLPVAVYDHTVGCAIIGGYRYRGSRFPPMLGQYFYGDECSGALFALHGDPVAGWTTTALAGTGLAISSFGEDEQGAPYLVDLSPGSIYRFCYASSADAFVGGTKRGSFDTCQALAVKQNYTGVNAGPVQAASSIGAPTVASERVVFGGGSYSEMMGFPNNTTTHFWFPWYNNTAMDSQFRVSNLGTTPTTITVVLGGSTIDSFSLAAGAAIRKNYPGQNNGPMQVTSSGGVPILPTIRVLFAGTSYSEMMGYPSNTTTQFWFPSYDDVSLDSQLRVSNLGVASTTITVSLAGSMIDSFGLGAGAAVRRSYPGQNNGPLQVSSSGGVPILSTIRFLSGGTSFSEMMGFPNNTTTDFWFPWYDDVGADSQLWVNNLGGSAETITVYLAGNPIDSFSLAAGAMVRKTYTGQNNGPLHVVSMGGMPILSAVRILFQGASFQELMGYAGNALTGTQYFPWYNNTAMVSELRFAVP